MELLIFNPSSLPRSMTRREWKEADRWRRTVQRKLSEEMNERLDILAEFGAELPRRIRQELTEGLINPPAIIHPAHSRNR